MYVPISKQMTVQKNPLSLRADCKHLLDRKQALEDRLDWEGDVRLQQIKLVIINLYSPKIRANNGVIVVTAHTHQTAPSHDVFYTKYTD